MFVQKHKAYYYLHGTVITTLLSRVCVYVCMCVCVCMYTLYVYIYIYKHKFVYACSVSNCPVFWVILVMAKILQLRLSGHFLSLGRRLRCKMETLQKHASNFLKSIRRNQVQEPLETRTNLLRRIV
jgi:hypothetical protein